MSRGGYKEIVGGVRPSAQATTTSQGELEMQGEHHPQHGRDVILDRMHTAQPSTNTTTTVVLIEEGENAKRMLGPLSD
jgi:hypothetical protein